MSGCPRSGTGSHCYCSAASVTVKEREGGGERERGGREGGRGGREERGGVVSDFHSARCNACLIV